MSSPPASSAKPAPRRRPHSATKQMVWLGMLALCALAIYHARSAGDDAGPLWRVFAGIAACAYLWWLATLLFDLVFVWHRYIRHAVALKFLRAEVKRADLSPKGDAPQLPPDSPREDAEDDDNSPFDKGTPVTKPNGPVIAPGAGPLPRPNSEQRPSPM